MIVLISDAVSVSLQNHSTFLTPWLQESKVGVMWFTEMLTA